MTAGRPKKPNEMHIFEGTARNDRGTDVVLQIDGDNAREPTLQSLTTIDREETFNMFKDWVIMATGSAKIDEILLSMMVDQLEIYTEAKADRDVKTMGLTVDRFHKLAREFGMTPSTRSQMINAASANDADKDDLMEGP